MMLHLNTAPPAAKTPAGGAPADPATLGGIDFTDMLTQLMAPSGEGHPVDVKRLLRQGLVATPQANVATAVVIDGALSVATPPAGDVPVAPRAAGGAATTSDVLAGDEPKDPVPTPVAVIDMVLAPVQPLTATASAAPGTPSPAQTPAQGGVQLQTVPVPGPLGIPVSATKPVAAPPPADSAEAPPAGTGDMPRAATTGGPQTAPDAKTIPPVANPEILLDMPPLNSAPAVSAEGVLTIPRPTMLKPASQATAIAALKLAGASPAASLADASQTAVESSGADPETSGGDARSGGGHGQTLQSAPAPVTAQEAPIGPISGSIFPMPGTPGPVVGQGMAPAPLHPADAAELAPQIVQAIKIQWQGGIGEARIRLHPEYLGELTIAIRIERGGAVTASLESDSSPVRQWLQSNESSLRQGLADQGLHLERLQVSEQSPRVTWDGEKRREEGQPSPNRNRQSSQRRRPDEPTFEVVA
jgi:hypothetical protein